MPSRAGLAALVCAVWSVAAPAVAQEPPSTLRSLGPDLVIGEADCTVARLGSDIPVAAIGEPVSGVTLSAPQWTAAGAGMSEGCLIDGAMAPIDPAAPDINFRVLLPARWNHRAAQQGGGGINGTIPNLSGRGYPVGGRTVSELGFATFGSDSGHQMAFGRRGGPPPAGAGRGGARGGREGGGRARGAPPAFEAPPGADDWALNDEAMRNLGYMQLKKTRDAAMVLIDRMYGEAPRYTYFTGTSQGGREALTVAQRYPDDYDGIIANVPIVSFSSLMLAPEWIRIQEKPLATWVTPAKVNAIRGEFMRQCDGLDGLVDGVMNNYVACRAIFDVSQGAPGRHPWAARRCPGGVDPNPSDESAAACLTDGQIATLELVYRPYAFATPLAHDTRSFGMWVPNTDPSGSGLILGARFRGQEGAPPDAPRHSHLGVLGVTAFLMRDLDANPLDYVEGGRFDARRREISEPLDSTDPDLRAFAARGGKAIVTIGTNDTLASPGAQLDYYQALLDTMGRPAVDDFARLFVIPQAGHGLTGSAYGVDGDGGTIPTPALASGYERFAFLLDWVEGGQAPGMSLTVRTGERSMPLCSYPAYPRYTGGPMESASSYACAAP